MLLQVKASLNHGDWLPWLKQQQESGLIGFSESTAKRYMRVAANRSHVTDLEAPSIRAALELLSDKEPGAEQADPNAKPANSLSVVLRKAKLNPTSAASKSGNWKPMQRGWKPASIGGRTEFRR